AAARAAQRADPGGDADRYPGRRAARRHRDYRNGVRAAGGWAAGDRGDRLERHSAGAGDRAAAGRNPGADESDGRSFVQRARPARALRLSGGRSEVAADPLALDAVAARAPRGPRSFVVVGRRILRQHNLVIGAVLLVLVIICAVAPQL